VDFLEPGFAQRSLRGFRQENRSTLQPDDGSLREICLGWAYASESEPVDFVVFSLERVPVSICSNRGELATQLTAAARITFFVSPCKLGIGCSISQ
jgi:hypothetical protein